MLLRQSATPDAAPAQALPAPKIYGKNGKVANWTVEESYPDAVGAFVDWLVRESGWKVSERGKAAVPLQARHVCLLFKRFQSFGDDLTRAYVRALEARRIPHVLVGGRSFYDREEVLAVRNALVAIEWPDDELAVYATLRGPFFALPDDALLAYRDAEHERSAYAQTAKPPPGDVNALEEVIVTARRKEERLQSVPLAITQPTTSASGLMVVHVDRIGWRDLGGVVMHELGHTLGLR